MKKLRAEHWERAYCNRHIVYILSRPVYSQAHRCFDVFQMQVTSVMQLVVNQCIAHFMLIIMHLINKHFLSYRVWQKPKFFSCSLIFSNISFHPSFTNALCRHSSDNHFLWLIFFVFGLTSPVTIGLSVITSPVTIGLSVTSL